MIARFPGRLCEAFVADILAPVPSYQEAAE